MSTAFNLGCRRAGQGNVINAEESINKEQGGKVMSKFEKYLALWVALCMVVGVVLSQTVPGISKAIDSWQIRGISIPLASVCF
jgi:ACR3 family arsenite transporter